MYPHELTPIGAVAAGLHNYRDDVTLTGTVADLQLYRTVTTGPEGSFMLRGDRTGVRIDISERLLAESRPVLCPVKDEIGNWYAPQVTVTGWVARHFGPPQVIATAVTAGPDTPPGEPVDILDQDVRLRPSAVAMTLGEDRLRRVAADGSSWTMFAAIIQTVRARKNGTAMVVLVGPEDGATIPMYVPAAVYTEVGAQLMPAAGVSVCAYVRRTKTGVYLVARSLTLQPPGTPAGSLLRIPLDPGD